MSEENLKTLHAWLDAWNRGDWDTTLEQADPGFVLDNSTIKGEWRGTHRGADEIKRMWHRMTEPWERVEVQLGEIIESRDDLVLTSVKARFYGRDGMELPGPVRPGWIWEFRNGVLVRLTVYSDLRDALEAVGLQE